MFTSKPAKKNGLFASLNGNGHKNGNGHNGNGNGHNGNGNGHNGNGHGSIDTVLGPGVHFKGTLTGNGGVRIEGSFDGTLNLKGPLVIAEGAKVTATEIQASAVSVAGSVKSNIKAGKVEILATGRIWGDLVTASFATEEGAFLRGQITMQETVELPAASTETVPAEAVAAPAPVPAGEPAPAPSATLEPIPAALALEPTAVAAAISPDTSP